MAGGGGLIPITRYLILCVCVESVWVGCVWVGCVSVWVECVYVGCVSVWVECVSVVSYVCGVCVWVVCVYAVYRYVVSVWVGYVWGVSLWVGCVWCVWVSGICECVYVHVVCLTTVTGLSACVLHRGGPAFAMENHLVSSSCSRESEMGDISWC